MNWILPSNAVRPAGRLLRASSIALGSAAALLLATPIFAQVDEGDILVLTFDVTGGIPLHLYDKPTGVTTSVSGLPGDIAQRATGLEIDPVSGDAFLFSRSPVGGEESEVWLLRLTGSSASASLVHTFPAGYELVDTDRARSGCMIAMLEDGDNPNGDYALFERLTYSNGSMLVQSVPLTGVKAGDSLRSIAFDNSESILVGFESGVLIAKPGIYQADAGGPLVRVVPSPSLRPFALEAELPPTSTLMIGGSEPSFGTSAKNFGCLYQAITLLPVGQTSNAPVIVRDIYYEEDQDRFLVGTEDPSILPGSGGALLALDNAPCGFANQVVLAMFLDSVKKVASRGSSIGFGCGCVHDGGAVARMEETSKPTPGSTWDLSLEFGVPSSMAFVIANDVGGLIPVGSFDCLLLVDPSGVSFSSLVPIDSAGSASIQIPVPAAASFTELFGQWVMFEAGPGFALTAGILTAP